MGELAEGTILRLCRGTATCIPSLFLHYGLHRGNFQKACMLPQDMDTHSFSIAARNPTENDPYITPAKKIASI